VSSIVPATGRAVANEIERQLVVERRIDGIVGSDEADGIAIGRRAQHRRHADISAGADLVLDDELLAEPLRQILSDDTRDDVVWPAGSERHDPMDRSRRITLRPGNAGHGRQRSSTRGHLQECAAGKFQGIPPRWYPREQTIMPLAIPGAILLA